MLRAGALPTYYSASASLIVLQQLKLNAREKTLGAVEKFEDFETFSYKMVFQNPQIFHQFSPERSTLAATATFHVGSFHTSCRWKLNKTENPSSPYPRALY
jgi:hypothetical protein